MYLCICNAIRECDLRDAARFCAGPAEMVYNHIGKTPQCRQCLDDADEFLAHERALKLLPELLTA